MQYDAAVGTRFWYEFDRATKYTPAFFTGVINPAGALQIQDVYAQARKQHKYPAAVVSFVTPRKDFWDRIAKVQADMIQTYLQNDADAIRRAFEDFGQGVLISATPERIAIGDPIHTMDTGNSPPVGYHRWHASLRVLQLVGIGDAAYWERLDEYLGLAWALQSHAFPKQQTTPNPAVPDADLVKLRSVWLGMPAYRRDRQYDLGTAIFGYPPSPMIPVA